MTTVYMLAADGAHEELERLLSEYLRRPFPIEKTAAGKPYIAGDPVYFSLAHCGGRAAAAISDKPCGIDLELYGRGICRAVTRAFSDRERAEISDEREFLRHWTAREAYVKMLGGNIFGALRRTEFSKGKLYDGGKAAKAEIVFYELGYGVAALCKEK